MRKVIFMGEGLGVYTKGYFDKPSAVIAMRKAAERDKALDGNEWEDYYKFQPEEITDESVKETRYYQHRRCEGETVGDDNICYHCSDSINSGGRPTYAFFAKTS